MAASAYPYSYVRSTSSPFSGSDDDEPLARLPSLFSDVCSPAPATPATPYTPSDLFVSASPSPPATSYPAFFNPALPRPQHLQHTSVSSASADDVSDSEDSNGSVPGPSRVQAMDIRDDDDDFDDDDPMHDVQVLLPPPPPPSHTVVALLPRADPPHPLPLPREHTNPMLVSLVPIAFGSGADLMSTGSSQIVNVRPCLPCPCLPPSRIVIDTGPF